MLPTGLAMWQRPWLALGESGQFVEHLERLEDAYMYQNQSPEKPSFLTEEEWQGQLEEMRAFSKRVWRQSGGRLDVYPYPASQLEPKK
jgi:hypothetical protein